MLEVLGRLTPKTPSLTPIGGIPEISWEDVAASLPHLSRHGTLYIYAKYIDLRLDPELLAEAKSVALQKYGDKDHARVKSLAAIALDQALNPGHCKKCNGSGQIASREGFKVCDSCQGTGRAKELSQRQLMRSLSVSACTAKNVWRPRLNEQLAIYQNYDDEAGQSLKRLRKSN